MRITYVLPFPELNGGNKVIFQHARLLAEIGEEVTLLGEGARPEWIAVENYHNYAARPVPALPRQDLVIASYWTTVATARQLGLGPLAHFCQGYEGDLEHLLPQRAAIEAIYRAPLPTLTVTPCLAEQLAARFGRISRVVPPPLDRQFRPRGATSWFSPRRRPWISVPGLFESPVKDVRTALAAVTALRGRGLACRVLRLSTLPITAEERAMLVPDRELIAVPPSDVARALRGCDLLFLPSLAAEGFGLPLLEAMASGVPAVASRIPSTEFIAGETVALVEPGQVEAFAAAAARLLGDRGRWRQARQRGLARAEAFAAERVAPALREAVAWAAAEAARATGAEVPA